MSIQPRQKTRLEIDELRSEVLRAQQMTDQDRFLAGAELFDYACSITLAGIRAQNPNLSSSEHQEVLKNRIHRGRSERRQVAQDNK